MLSAFLSGCIGLFYVVLVVLSYNTSRCHPLGGYSLIGPACAVNGNAINSAGLLCR